MVHVLRPRWMKSSLFKPLESIARFVIGECSDAPAGEGVEKVVEKASGHDCPNYATTSGGQ